MDNKRLYKLGNKTFSYEQALEKLDLTLLVDRREGLTNKLALKSVKKEKSINSFKTNFVGAIFADLIFAEGNELTNPTPPRTSRTVFEKCCSYVSDI